MWTDLSMKDKSDLMSLFLKQGISSLSDMRRVYDGLSDIESTQNLTVSKSKNEFEPQKPLREPLHNKDIIYTIGNWLNNRREQLYNNMMEMYNDGNLQFENRKIFGLPIFEEASPLYNNTKNNIVSSEINNQLLRAESAKYKEELLPLFTNGLYDTKKNEVILSDVLGKKSNYNKNVVKLHEFAHSSGQESPQEYVIAKHFNKEKYKNKDSYLFDPSEIYSKLTTFRQIFNLDPTKKYSLDDIKELRKSINEKYKDPFNKEILEPIKKDIHKLKVDYIMKNIPDELRNSWWWKDDKSFEKTLLNDSPYTDTILNDFYKALPEDLLKKIDKLNKKGESLIKEKLGGMSEEEFKTKYFEGSDWINQFNDEDLMFLINDVAQNSGNLSLKNLAAFGGRIYDGEQNINTYQLSLDNYSKYKNKSTFTSEDLNIRPAPINYDELALRQRYTESTFNNEAVSPKGATGAYGIMPHIHKWYVEETGDTGDLTDLAYNKRIRDWLMERNLRSDIHSTADTDSVRVGKQLAQYNYGSGNTRTLLKQLEDKGVDTHSSFEWLDYFPKETRDYTNFVLRNKDINQHKNTEAFNRALKNLKK